MLTKSFQNYLSLNKVSERWGEGSYLGNLRMKFELVGSNHTTQKDDLVEWKKTNWQNVKLMELKWVAKFEAMQTIWVVSLVKGILRYLEQITHLWIISCTLTWSRVLRVIFLRWNIFTSPVTWLYVLASSLWSPLVYCWVQSNKVLCDCNWYV